MSINDHSRFYSSEMMIALPKTHIYEDALKIARYAQIHTGASVMLAECFLRWTITVGVPMPTSLPPAPTNTVRNPSHLCSSAERRTVCSCVTLIIPPAPLHFAATSLYSTTPSTAKLLKPTLNGVFPANAEPITRCRFPLESLATTMVLREYRRRLCLVPERIKHPDTSVKRYYTDAFISTFDIYFDFSFTLFQLPQH